MKAQKNWLITGISSGLGQALAHAVMNAGGFVIGTFRQQAQVDVFNEQFAQKGFALLLDITDAVQVNHVVKQVMAQFGRIDVLVNNAGVGFVGAVEEASEQEIRAVFEANFFGTLSLTQSVLPHMRAANYGHIVQISSQSGVRAAAGFGIYNASKFALEGFSEALAQEVNPLGIKVTLVEPGPFRTDFAGRSLGQAQKVIPDYAATAGAFRNKLNGVNGKQEGHPEKAARAIIQHVASENPALRLPLGKIALANIQAKIDSLQHDVDNSRAVAESVVYGS